MIDLFNRNHLSEFISGSPALSPNSYELNEILSDQPAMPSLKFRAFKLCFDYGSALLVLPIVATIAIVMHIINPFFNPGPIFFVQERMGQNGNVFRMIKFRTMACNDASARDPEAKVEDDRITKIGHFMRKTRIDELPNFFNVLRGEMSVIGPRPDAYSHAEYFSNCVLGYTNRHRVKPGITGLSQVEMGYTEGADATFTKSKYDNIYITRLCGRLDLYIIYRTFFVLVRAVGR